MLKECYTFDDVSLVPRYNNVESRRDPVLKTWLSKGQEMEIPILASNMDSVICDDLADVLVENGSIPIFHRFTSLEKQREWCEKYSGKCFISCGMKNVHEVTELMNHGALGTCIDIAHGHSNMMLDFISDLRGLTMRSKNDEDRLKQIIAGNVCTGDAVHDLAIAGCDAVKVGIGAGSCCETSKRTGFGVPMVSAIMDCAKRGREMKVPIIADGGIKSSREVSIALAAGASSCMLGNRFGKTRESAGKKVVKDGVEYVVYRGQASKEFQDEFYGGMREKTVAEGISFETKCSGSAQEVVDELLGGLRSAMTYGGSKTIKEFQSKAEFIKVTRNYIQERDPRPNQ